MILKDYRFLDIASPILQHPEFLKTKNIKHHDESTYEHSLKVAYYSYKLCYISKLDWESCIRGALLHDFFLYKFNKKKHICIISDSLKHAINHPKIAHKNASKFFKINKKESNIIKGHMFPFGLPRCREAWIVSFVDKYVATIEYSKNLRKLYLKKKLEKVYSE